MPLEYDANGNPIDSSNSGGTGLSGADYMAIAQLANSDLLAWYSATHNQPLYGAPGVVMQGPGGFGATAGFSSLLVVGAVVIGVVLLLR